jgi:hypothetical protein
MASREFDYLSARLVQVIEQFTNLSRDLNQSRGGFDGLDPAEVEIGLTMANQIASVIYRPRIALDEFRRKEGL